MSENIIITIFITLSGGLQDAYTYMLRGQVFANAQTGNIVLMSEKFFTGNLSAGLKYLIPLMAFSIGVFTSEKISFRFKESEILNWKQIVLAIECICLLMVGFIPSTHNTIANAMVSFACAMQVQAFKKVNGHPFASTMCIGNLRSGVEALSIWFRTKDALQKERLFHYFFVIITFALGAGIGAKLSDVLGFKLIFVCCGLLFVALMLFFVEKKIPIYDAKSKS